MILTYWNLSVLEYRCRAARLLQWGGKISKSFENRWTIKDSQSLTTPCKPKNMQQFFWTKTKTKFTARQQRAVPFTNMKWDIFSVEVFYHGPAGLVHQLLSEPQTSVGALHCLEDRDEGFYYPRKASQISQYYTCCNLSNRGDVWGVSHPDSPVMWCVRGVHHLDPPP